jgi:DNA-binding XRE family transcriptional regulator
MAKATEGIKKGNRRKPVFLCFIVSFSGDKNVDNKNFTRPIVGGPIDRTAILLKIMNIKEKFGLKVKVMRVEKNFSIEQLANISNVDRNYISDIEKGQRNVSLEIIEKIIHALDVDFATFFNDKSFRR